MRSIHTMEYDSALKRKDILSPAATGIDLEDNTPSETNESQKE